MEASVERMVEILGVAEVPLAHQVVGVAQAGQLVTQGHVLALVTSASKRSMRRFVITEKAPTRAFSWLKAATTAFTFKTLLRH